MFVYAGFTAVTEKLDEIIERLPPPRQAQGKGHLECRGRTTIRPTHSRRNYITSYAGRRAHQSAGCRRHLGDGEVNRAVALQTDEEAFLRICQAGSNAG